MIRKLVIASMALSLALTTVACSNPSYNSPDYSSPRTQQQSQSTAPTQINDGQYPVQQASYDDSTGEYTLILLNTAPGQPAMYRTANIPMARLTNEEVSSGQKSYLKVEQGKPALYLTEDFKIEYVHNVTENQVNPQTGQQEVVVVRQEPSFWSPFAGALAGQALGSLLFRPQYYMPPVYQPGVILRGYGGYGSSYDQAVSRYQTRYQAPPAEVQNRQAFRSTGQLRSPSFGQSRLRTSSKSQSNRSTGSGYGSSTLRRSDRSTPRIGGGSSSFGSRRSTGRVGGRRR